MIWIHFGESEVHQGALHQGLGVVLELQFTELHEILLERMTKRCLLYFQLCISSSFSKQNEKVVKLK